MTTFFKGKENTLKWVDLNFNLKNIDLLYTEHRKVVHQIKEVGLNLALF